MREDAALLDSVAAGLMLRDVSAVDDGYIAQHACADNALLHGERGGRFLVKKRDLLVARRDLAPGGDADEERRQKQLQAILVALDDGVAPLVFELLHLFDLDGLA